eukprot:185468-Chlamydomonas_euryale.AAC.3
MQQPTRLSSEGKCERAQCREAPSKRHAAAHAPLKEGPATDALCTHNDAVCTHSDALGTDRCSTGERIDLGTCSAKF